MQDLLSTIGTWAASTGIKIVISIVVLIVAFKLIDFIAEKLKKANDVSGKLDATIFKTIVSVGKTLLKILVVVSLIGYLGIDTTAIAAMVASLGVAIGLAVNGAVANMAGGVLLLVTRPFRLGDFIDVGGTMGTVEEITLNHTRIVTLDNRVVYIPNGTASTATVINFSEKDTRRVDITYSIPYTQDFKKAEEVILAVAEAEEKVLKDPAPFARVLEQGKTGHEITARMWCSSSDYWDTYFDLLEKTKKALGEAGFTAGHEQVDVHMMDK